MLRIGILSDTHGFIHPRVLAFFKDVDEIWHAGDIGTPEILEQLRRLKPVRAVYGNIDGHGIRFDCPEIQRFRIENTDVLMTHIGGYPGRYNPAMRVIIEQEKPNLLICGHSHILKVIYDKKYGLLHINPGAAGNSGLHKSITAVRLTISGKEMKDMEVLDIPR